MLVNLEKLCTGELLKLQLKIALELGKRHDSLAENTQPKVKTRKNIIEDAKNDLELLKQGNSFYSRDCFALNVEFVVNKEKRTVVALLKGAASGVLRYKGIAKCDPDDTFNSHIGKVIALYRGLGKDVPEKYLKVEQPTKAEHGDIVKYNGNVYTVTNGKWKPGYAQHRSSAALNGTIIDDSKE